MANINTIKNAVEIRSEIKANGTTVEYVVINGQNVGILGSVNKKDREAALKVLNTAYVASGGDIYKMMCQLSTVAMMEEKQIEPDEMVEVCGEEIILSYSKKTAYDMNGNEVANCNDLPDLSADAIKALLMARVEAAKK